MEEIKVGEYVRYADGCICKITEDFKDYNLETATIINHSPEIIDLIEVGDYVNGERVTEIKEWNSSKYGYFRYAVTCHYEIIRADEIKSIVTKEQFESIKYEVE